jgi:hypothetical protein
MKKPSFVPSVSILTVVLSLLAAVGDSRAYIITWTNLSSGNWSKATNWDPNQVPSTNDTALITLAGTYRVRLDVSSTVSNLTLGGDIGVQTLLLGATLSLSGAGTIASNGVCDLVAGALNGGGALTVEGAFNWSGGTLAGVVAVASNGVLRINGTLDKLLDAGVLENSGTVTWTDSGRIVIDHGGAIENSGTFVAENDGFMLANYGAASFFSNIGIFRKVAGTGQTQLGITSFNNAGVADVLSGTLSVGFNSGTNNGVFNAASNAVIQVQGSTSLLYPCTFNSGSSFTGPGLKRFIAGYITLNGTLFAQNLDLAGAALLGDCTLTEGPVLLNPVPLAVAIIMGKVNVPTNVVLSITGNVAIEGGQFNNAGSVIWTGSGFFGLDIGGVFNNSGTFDIQNDSTFFYNGGNAAINNTGLFRKSAGTNTTTVRVGIAFNNSGLVDVQSGTLSVNTFGTNSGTFNAGSNAVILVSQTTIPNAFYQDTSGTFNAASNGLIVFSGWFSGSGSAFTGPGVKRFISGQLFGRIVAQNLEVAGVSSSNPFEVVGGLGGNCTLTEGPILWTGGGIGGFPGSGHAVSTDSNVLLFISGTNNLAAGQFTNNGTAFWMSSGLLGQDYGARLYNAGTLVVRTNMTVKGTDSGFFNSGRLVNEGATSTMNFGQGESFYNSGTVDVGSGTVAFAGGFRPFTQTAGLLRLAGGNVLAPWGLNIQGGTLSGYGTITGDVINGGTVSPGNPAGTLTITRSYTQTGELDIDLGGRAPGVDYDQLIVTGRANLRGVLRVALDSGFMPALGDNFSVLSFGSRVGKFDCLIGANLGGGINLLANYSPTNLVLMTTNGPVQTNTMTIFTCGAHPPHLQFTGLPGQTYSIEATTNVVTVTNCVPDPCQILSRFDNWVTLFRTNSPTGEIDFDDPAAASLDHRFYRARLEP